MRVVKQESNASMAAPPPKIPQPIQISLPEEMSEPIKTLEEALVLIYGEKKIGKTSLASRFNKAFFLMFEPGGKGLSIYQKTPRSWGEFIAYIAALEQDQGRFGTVVVDTIDACYEMCFDQVCKTEGFDHPSDKPYGAGWKAISREFTKQFGRLLRTGKGVVALSHATDKEFQSITSKTYSKLVPTMAGQAVSYISALADIIMYYGYYGEERYITIKGSDSVEAGTRLEKQFWVKDKFGQERVHSISMGKSPDEGYANIVKAFNNEQEGDGRPSTAYTGLSEVPVKMKSKK